MKRTTIMLPDELDARARREARRRGVPLAEVLREAVERHLPAPTARRPLGFFAVGDGDEDGSERVDEIVAEVVERRHARR